MPLELNLVPALLHDNLESRVKVDGLPDLIVRAGEAGAGTVMVIAKPRIAEINSRVESRAVRSCSDNLLRKSIKGRIM